jgi:AmiR/NasT family two-component response regulator
MEREAITADRAFELLRKASQETQVKLRDIAREVLERHEERLGGANIRSL